MYPDGTKGSNTGSTGLYWWVTSQVGDSAKKQGIYDFFKFYNNHDNQVTWSLAPLTRRTTPPSPPMSSPSVR